MFFTKLISKLFRGKAPAKPHPYRYFQFKGDTGSYDLTRVIVCPRDGIAEGKSYWLDGSLGFKWMLSEIELQLARNPLDCYELTREEALKIIPNLP